MCRYGKQFFTPVQCAVISRAWDVAELLIRARCDISMLQAWVEHRPACVPDDWYNRLRELINSATVTPPKLRHLARISVRRLLGRQLLVNIGRLAVPPSTQHFILYHELFRAHAGSFEVWHRQSAILYLAVFGFKWHLFSRQFIFAHIYTYSAWYSVCRSYICTTCVTSKMSPLWRHRRHICDVTDVTSGTSFFLASLCLWYQI